MEIVDAQVHAPSLVTVRDDHTRTRAHHSYREVLDFLRATAELSDADKRVMSSDALRAWMRWPRDA